METKLNGVVITSSPGPTPKTFKDKWRPAVAELTAIACLAFVYLLNSFYSKEEWYLDHGISYQLGILLSGPPGTGKTSLAKAISSEYKKDLYILSPSSLHHIDSALSSIPEKSILLIEDIDTNYATNKRSQIKRNDKNEEDKELFSFTNLSDVLNAIDGIVVSHGRVLIATTNHQNKLDPALIREGRFDIKILIDYADSYILKQFFDRYYPNYKIDNNFKIKNEISSAKIQSLILKNLDNPQEVLKELTYYEN